MVRIRAFQARGPGSIPGWRIIFFLFFFIIVLPTVGIEPTATWLRVMRSTVWAKRAKKKQIMPPPGIEPGTLRSSVSRSPNWAKAAKNNIS